MNPKKTPAVLVVEDTAIVARYISRFLVGEGFTVRCAPSAEEGLSLVRAQPFDVILLDDGLPGMMGLAAIQEFKNISSAPVIFVTGRVNEDIIKDSLLLGASAFIAKPLDLDVLEQKIRMLLRS